MNSSDGCSVNSKTKDYTEADCKGRCYFKNNSGYEWLYGAINTYHDQDYGVVEKYTTKSDCLNANNSSAPEPEEPDDPVVPTPTTHNVYIYYAVRDGETLVEKNGDYKFEKVAVDGKTYSYIKRTNTSSGTVVGKLRSSGDYSQSGATVKLLFNDSSENLKITKTGYIAKDAQWTCIEGCTGTFKYGEDILLKKNGKATFCDASNGDCSVVLGVNWQENAKSTLRYEINSGSDSVKNNPEDQSFTDGSEITLSNNILERIGYKFKGWNTKADGTGTAYQRGTKVTFTGNVTLYAQWEAYKVNIYYVTYDDEVLYDKSDTHVLSKGTEKYGTGYYIMRDGKKLHQSIDYGTTLSDTIVDYDNNSNLLIQKVGYWGPEDEEWKCISDDCKGKTFDQAKEKYTTSEFCNDTILKNGDCEVILAVNWKPTELHIYYNSNGGKLVAGKHREGLGIDKNGRITSNNTSNGYIRETITYVVENTLTKAQLENLVVWNNPSNVNLEKSGFVAQSDAEWKCISDSCKGKTYDQTPGKVNGRNYVGYNASDFCDIKHKSCEVELAVNWVSEPTVSTFKVTYNKNTTDTVNNMPSPDYFTKTNGTASKLSDKVPTRKGYTFVGWNLKADGTGITTYNPNDNFEVDSNTDLVLYAQWRVNKVNIYYTIRTGDTLTSETREAGVTKKWSLDNNNYIQKTTTTGWTTNTVTLRTTIPYNGNICSNVDGSCTGLVNYNNTNNLYITKSGYSTKENEEWVCTSGDCIRNSVYSQSDLDYNATDFCSSTTLEKRDCTIVLAVNWVAGSEYSVTYNANGGTGGPTSQSKKHDVSLTLSRSVPTRAGFTFDVWKGSDGKDYKPGDSYNDNSNLILTAQWKENHKVTIYYKLGQNGYFKKGTTSDSNGRYTWDVDDNTGRIMITRSSDNVKEALSTTIRYGEKIGSNGLVDYNNDNYLTVARDGHHVVSGYEWVSSSGVIFNQEDATYSASDFCDARNADCSVELTVNWVIDEQTGEDIPKPTYHNVIINYKLNSGETLTDSSLSKNSNNIIVKNGQVLSTMISSNGYLASNSLGKYDGTKYLEITKNGYGLVSNQEWKCASGNCNRSTYGKSSSYNASAFCNATSSDCTVTLEANWRANNYTITYNKNGGTGYMLNTSCTYGQPCTLRSNSFSKSNYTFNGWKDSSDREYPDGYTFNPYNLTDNLTLTAQWKEIESSGGEVDPPVTNHKVNIIYNVNGGTISGNLLYNFSANVDGNILSNGQLLSSSILYGGKIGNNGLNDYNDTNYFNITKTGHMAEVGNEWKCLSNNCNKTYYSQSFNYGADDFCDASSSDCTVTLGVNWKPKSYTVSYDSAGGTGTMNPTSCTYGQTCSLSSNTFEKDGYYFVGWEDFNGNQYNGSFVYNMDEDIKVYAKWKKVETVEPEKEEFKAVFNPNGGILVGDSPLTCIVDNNSCVINEKIPTAIRDGYIFKGWGTTQYCSAGNVDSILLVDDTVYYACWIEDNVDGDGNVKENVQTGENTLIAIIWFIGLMSIGYAFYYFKTLRQN